MKHIINRFLSVAALLMLTIGASAEQTVTVNVTPNPNAGTVTKSVSDKGVCTLTVTPAHGYFMTEDNLAAVAILSGEAMQAPRRTIPVSEGTSLPITPDAANSDPAGVTTYTFTMPDESFNVEVTAEFQSMELYDLYIGETQVTELNASDVLKDGKVSFTISGGQDAAPTYTLKLNGAAITAPLKVGLANLTIDIQGTNTITTNETCLQIIDDAAPALTFTSTNDEVGNLTMTNSDGGVSDIGDITFGRELVPVLVNYGLYTSNMYYFTNGGCDKAMIVPSYGVKVGELQVYSGNADNVLKDEGSPTVVYDAEHHKLTLNGASAGEISTSLDNLIIELVGNNTLTQGASYATLQSMYGDNVTITIQSTGETKGSLTMSQPYTKAGTFADEHVTLNIVSPLAVVSGRLTGNQTNENTVVIGEANGLIVGGYAVTEDNCDDILKDGTVSYDATSNTLTLNGATLYPSSDWCVEVGKELSYLNVKLLGNNIMRGNAFKFVNSQPALVLTTDAINPGSLLIGPFTESQTPYSLISPDEKNGATVCYENGLGVDEDDQQIFIGGSSVNLKVGSVQVTSQNMDDILGDGKVSFNAQTKTLTLNGATINMSSAAYPIESDINDLTVLLKDNNTITVHQEIPYVFHFTGDNKDAKLSFIHEDNGFGNLIVNNGSLTEDYRIDYNANEMGWTVTENSIGYDAIFDLQIGATKFIASSLTIKSENGSATYNPFTHTLSLNNFTTTNAITTTLTNLTISLKGSNSVGAVLNSGESISDTITIQRDAMSDAVVNKLIATSINGFEMQTVLDPLKDISSATQIIFSDVVAYNLWVNGTQVTKENMDAVIANYLNNMGKIIFDGDHTLTLENIGGLEFDSQVPFIKNGLSQLIINLVGTNTVNCGQVFLAANDTYSHKATFTTSINNAGSLTISATSNNPEEDWYAGHTLDSNNGLEIVDNGVSNNARSISVAVKTVTSFGLAIAGVDVTNLNAETVTGTNITGSVSFDATTNTLTLDNATISGNITSGIETLIVELKGVNSMTGQFVKSGIGSKLVFNTVDTNGKLTMGADYEGLTAEYRSHLSLNDHVISLPTSYGITIAGTAISATNRKNITGENISGTVIFDNNARLILENATINGEIVVDAAYASLPNLSLTIYLKGENKINLTNLQEAFKCSGGTLTLTLTFDDSSQNNSLVINKLIGGNLYGTNVTLICDGLKTSLSQTETDSKLVIEKYLPPIVDGKNPSALIDFSQMSASTNMNGVVIGKVEYNLESETGDKGNSSGIDQTTGKLVFGQNDVMSEVQLKDGNDDGFKGVGMMLPAGEVEFGLHGVDLSPGFDMGVLVGNQELMSVRELLGISIPEDMISNKDVFMKLMNAQPHSIDIVIYSILSGWNHAPQMASHRIGPKSSVAGGLGGISVQSNSVQAAQGPANTYKSMEMSAMASALKSVIDAYSGFSCNDPDITDLPDNMFLKTNTTNAPSRRAAVETILPEGLTFVDFSNTKINGMEVSRTSGPFNGVPENVFIYMPAGNTSKAKNVVIGGICDNMELDGSENAQPFKAMKNFKAAQATLKRTFVEVGTGENKVRSTIYLPYAIPQEDADKLGKFYEYVSNDGTTVDMKMVTKGGLKANKPYIFEAKEGGVTGPMVRIVDVLVNPVETDGFKGTFERKNYEDGMYCYAGEAKGEYKVGQFVEMGPGSYVPPFRAYMMGNGAPSYAIAWDGVVDDIQNEENTTAIETVKTVADKKVAEGWWTISGMRLNAQPKKAGMYVFDGRLVVVK